MKKLIVMAVAGILAVSLAACGNASEQTSSKTAESAAVSSVSESAAEDEPAVEETAGQEAEDQAEDTAAVSEEPEAASAASEAPEDASAAGGASEDTEQTEEGSSDAEQEAAEGVHPYAWLGLQDIPKCDYLDALSTYHYIQTYVAHTSGVATEETEAVNGTDSVKINDYSRTYSIGGKVLTLNDSSRIYMEMGAEGAAAAGSQRIQEAQASGTNLMGRHFVGTGTAKVSENEDIGDDGEYEYYEYDYPSAAEVTGSSIVERFFMKDGDVYAVSTKTTMNDTEYEYIQVIRSMSQDIPDGTFEFPDTTGYEKYDLNGSSGTDEQR